MRTDKARPHLIMQELRSGRLRQGWGYQANQDLRIVLTASQSGQSLDSDQAAARRNLPMLGHDVNAMQRGDIVLLPNLPDPGTFSLCQLTGSYRFEIYDVDDVCDYGHTLPVELLKGCEGIPFANEHVGEGLRRTRRNIGRLWRLNHLREELELILTLAGQGATFEGRHGVEAQFTKLLGEVRAVRLSMGLCG